MKREASVAVNTTTQTRVRVAPRQTPPSVPYEQQFLNKTGKDFNTFYKKYYNKLVWIVQRMNINQIDAEDITNRAFMQALDKIEMYNPQYHFSTWLFDIGKKMAYQFKKDEKKKEILVDTTTESDENDNSFDPIQMYLKNKIDMYVDVEELSPVTSKKYTETLKEISRLDPKYRRIIELSDIQGKTYNEICDIMGEELCPAGPQKSEAQVQAQRLQTVKNRLHHGRLRLEANLRDRFTLILHNY
jgi:RNA polymerase sigma factor (sigma-70 family)